MENQSGQLTVGRSFVTRQESIGASVVVQDVEATFRAMGVSDEQYQELFKQYDTDGDGVIDDDEARAMLHDHLRMISENKGLSAENEDLHKTVSYPYTLHPVPLLHYYYVMLSHKI